MRADLDRRPGDNECSNLFACLGPEPARDQFQRGKKSVTRAIATTIHTLQGQLEIVHARHPPSIAFGSLLFDRLLQVAQSAQSRLS